MRKYFIGMLYVLVGSGMVGGIIGSEVGRRAAIKGVVTTIHNAAATGDEITIDGLRYRFVVVGKEE